jgi:hypothetical protein
MLVPGTYAAHGPEYAKVFLQIVRRFKGKEAHDILKQGFIDCKVKHTSSYDPCEWAKEREKRG